MVRIIHTSDTHLGYSQYHLSDRQDDFLDAFSQVVDAAIRDDVDVVVHSGDLFHNNRPTPTTIANTVKELQRLSDADIPFLAIIGNHEETSGSQWVDIFKEVELTERLSMDSPVTIDGVCFYGMDYVSQARREALQYEFGVDNSCDTNILVGHGLFNPLSQGATWDAKEVLSRANIEFDAFLLGDDHTPKTQELDGTLTTYAGSTERTASDQRDPRGYNVIEVTENGVTQSRELLNTRPFVYIDDIVLSDGDDVSVVKNEIDTYDNLNDSIVIVEVDGEGEPIMQAAVEQYVQSERGALKAKFYDRRESDAESASFDVQFADPDRAVEERLREMDLSEFAIELEREVRGDDVAKTTLPDQTQDTVKTALKDRPKLFDQSASFDDSDAAVSNSNSRNETETENDTDGEVADTWDEQYGDIEGENGSDEEDTDTDTETMQQQDEGEDSNNENVDVVSIDNIADDESNNDGGDSDDESDGSGQPSLTDF